jgi:hypothetical protein
MASELRVDTLKDASGNNSVGLSYVANGSAKAWNSFNGTGTIAFIKSLNGSSLVDSGTGEYDVNITSAMDSTSYSILCSNGLHVSHNNANTLAYQNTASQYSTAHWENNSKVDISYMNGQIHGDLA